MKPVPVVIFGLLTQAFDLFPPVSLKKVFYLLDVTPKPSLSRPLNSMTTCLCLSLGVGLLGLVAAGLLLGGGLHGALGAADGGDTLDGGLAEVGTVAAGSSLAGDGGVSPIFSSLTPRPPSLVMW